MIYLTEELKDINYVVVGIELKSSANMEQQGYLIGFQPIVPEDFDVVKSDKAFIWLFRRGAVHMFHPDYYYVSDVTIGFNKETSAMRTFRNTEDSQKDALECISQIIKSLTDKQMTRTNGLIDYMKYTNVPEAVKSAIEISTSTTSTKIESPRSTIYGSSAASVIHTPVPVTYAPYVPKEVSTISFKRTTKYSIADAMARMIAKIAEIKANTYQPPQLKHIPADDVAKEEKVTTNTPAPDNDYEDYANMGCY